MKKFVPQWVINYFYHLPLAFLANVYYDFPARGLKVIGVTGTDGKTTTTNMIYQILKSAGKKVSMISTINAFIAGKSYDTGFHVTSPDPFMVQKFARQSVDAGDEYMVLEVTSHALDQYRFWGIKFDVGVITNITHEHLDYHQTFENYKNAKLKLLNGVKFAIVNQNVILSATKNISFTGIQDDKRVTTFGLNKGDFNQKEVKLKLSVSGDYNIENALAAMAVGYVLNIPRKKTRAVLEQFETLIGRMEEVENEQSSRAARTKKGIKIFIDFAHTPNGLENALKTLRGETRGKLISVIGCEGFRDVEKRAMMGEIAQKLSDIVIVTAVDPRGQLEEINKQIVQGLEKAGGKKDQTYFVIDDRQQAINFAINNLAKKGDTIGIFGKGHERSMNIDGKKEISWSDAEAVKKAFS